jgi:hypothetical protein
MLDRKKKEAHTCLWLTESMLEVLTSNFLIKKKKREVLHTHIWRLPLRYRRRWSKRKKRRKKERVEKEKRKKERGDTRTSDTSCSAVSKTLEKKKKKKEKRERWQTKRKKERGDTRTSDTSSSAVSKTLKQMKKKKGKRGRWKRKNEKRERWHTHIWHVLLCGIEDAGAKQPLSLNSPRVAVKCAHPFDAVWFEAACKRLRH